MIQYLIFPHGYMTIMHDSTNLINKIMDQLPITFLLTDDYIPSEEDFLLCNIIITDTSSQYINHNYTNVKIHGGDYTQFVRRFINQSSVIYCFNDNTQLCFDEKNKEVRCFIENNSIYALRSFIKEIVLEYYYSLGYLSLHAAAFVYGGKGYLITGNKGDGKTTTLMSLYTNIGVDLLSNDRVLIKRDNENFKIMSLDSHIRLTEDTIKLLELDSIINVKEKNHGNNKPIKTKVRFKDFSGIFVNEISLDGIIVCDKNNKEEYCTRGYIPAYAIIDDLEEHPRWLNMYDDNSDSTERQLSSKKYKCIHTSRYVSINSMCDYIIQKISQE